MTTSKKIRPAVFLDRDGTLIEERGYPSRADQVALVRGAAAAVRRLRALGFGCVVVTNQSGVGRGLITLEQMHAVNAEMLRQFQEAGAPLDGLYYCTAAPLSDDKTVIEHSDRKPGPGMLLRAAKEMHLDLARSWTIGDSVSDVLAGRNAGCRESLLVGSAHPLPHGRGSDALVFDDLSAAVDYIASLAIAA
ncbi:MAG: HAD-IIIA family hydrolase [Gemmataceae bacterium]|nr:HAD-IIIA family hydrolase [Gemmataceae bacterium]